MKKTLAILFAAFASAALAQTSPQVAAPAATPTGLAIAVIDVDQIVAESPAGKEIMARLSKMRDDKLAQRKKMVDDQANLQKQLTSGAAALSDAKRAELQKQLEDGEIAMRRFDDDAQQQLQEAQAKELQALEKQIMPVINELGREMKLQLIFNKYKSGLVFAADQVDITDVVLKRFSTRVMK